MASSAAAVRRRRSANNARIAAKQRRQKILVVVLLAILAALLAWEIPHLRERSRDDSSSAAGAPPASIRQTERKQAPGGGTGADPFAFKALPDGDAHAVASGGPDPFKAGSPSSATSSAAALPGRIVIGQPGGHRVAARGWIVILAS